MNDLITSDVLSPTLKKKHLTKGQLHLYELIIKKIDVNEHITLQDAVKIYINFVCRDVRERVPYYYDWRYSYDDVKKNVSVNGYQ